MPFFHFHQNNSGGRFVYDMKAGITEEVVVEAENAEAANRRLEDIGGYFDGCDRGRDCDCCGDRWSRQWGGEKGDPEPLYYDTPVAQVSKETRWRNSSKPAIAVHYFDGRIEFFG